MVDKTIDNINPFKAFWERGFERLCPITPPNAELDPRGAMARRIAKNPNADARGKAPGVPGQNGWIGFDFVAHESDPSDLGAWARAGAGVGVKTGRGVIAVDVDVTNARIADATVALAERMLGPAPIRYGRAPKALLVYRTDEEIPYDKVTFSTETEDHALVEVLTEGRQFVAHGVHPKTGKPYSWPDGLPSADKLSTVTHKQLDAFLERIRERMPASQRFTGSTADRSAVDQSNLRGKAEVLAEAVRATPNSSDLFPTRDDYLRFGYAIKAAFGPDREAEAFELFGEWCSKWDGGYNDPDEVDADWRRMKPPFSVGASFVYDMAEKHGGWAGRAKEFFDPIVSPAEGDDFLAAVLNPVSDADDEPVVAPITAKALDFDELDNIPPRQWLYGTKISRRYATILASPGGVGKSSLASLIAASCASGEQLLHDKPVDKLKVLIYNQEDDALELRRRMKPIFAKYGLGREDASRIFILSGRERRLNLLTVGSDGQLHETKDVELLKQEINDKGIDLLICDPLARCHSAPENDTTAQDDIMRIFNQIADETNCGVLLVHHFRKGGEGGSMDSVRGSTALSAGARSILTLTPMSEEEAELQGVDPVLRRHYVRVDDAKNNMAPARAAEWFKLESVNLGNGNEMYPEGDDVQCVVTPDFNTHEPEDPDRRKAVLAQMAEADAAGDPYSPKRQAKKWAGAAITSHYTGLSIAQVLTMLERWERRGFIEQYKHSGKWAYRVNGVATSEDAIRDEREELTPADFFKPVEQAPVAEFDLFT